MHGIAPIRPCRSCYFNRLSRLGTGDLYLINLSSAALRRQVAWSEGAGDPREGFARRMEILAFTSESGSGIHSRFAGSSIDWQGGRHVDLFVGWPIWAV